MHFALETTRIKYYDVIIFNNYLFILIFNCIKLRFHIQRIVVYCSVT